MSYDVLGFLDGLSPPLWYRCYYQRFKQAQPKMCHSSKVEDGVKITLSLLTSIFLEKKLQDF